MARFMIILVLLALVSGSPAVAVDTLQVTTPDPVLEPWRWTAYDKSSGLIGNIRALFEDRDGALWLATYQGLHRYDADPFLQAHRHHFVLKTAVVSV